MRSKSVLFMMSLCLVVVLAAGCVQPPPPPEEPDLNVLMTYNQSNTILDDLRVWPHDSSDRGPNQFKGAEVYPGSWYRLYNIPDDWYNLWVKNTLGFSTQSNGSVPFFGGEEVQWVIVDAKSGKIVSGNISEEILKSMPPIEDIPASAYVSPEQEAADKAAFDGFIKQLQE